MNRMTIFCAMVATGCGGSAQGQPSPASLRQPNRDEPAQAEHAATPAAALAVVDFWREAGPQMWFAKDPALSWWVPALRALRQPGTLLKRERR